MKRQDIRLGVIYAKTGALAYGTEPNTGNPLRVRFLQPLVPHVQLRTIEVIENTRPNARHAHTTREVKREYVPKADLPMKATKGVLLDQVTVERAEVGTLLLKWDCSPGDLLAEYSQDGQEWRRTLVAPAEVHRTWDEHWAMLEEKRRIRHENEVAAWPVRLDRLTNELVITAHKKANHELLTIGGQTEKSLLTESGQRLLRTYVAATIQEALLAHGVDLDLPKSPKKSD